jgi:hypothetical protein
MWLISVVASVAIAFIGVLIATFVFQQNKIHIEPIANLKIVHHMYGTSEIYGTSENVKPISEIVNLVNVNTDSGKKPILSGYLANLRDVCDRFDNPNAPKEILDMLSQVKPSLVLVKTSNGFTAGTVNVNQRTCNLVKKINDSSIYVVSDSPFREVPSAGGEAFLIVEPLKAGY